jgi:cytoskeleton protein RodZ
LGDSADTTRGAKPFFNLGGSRGAEPQPSSEPSRIGTLLCATRMRMGRDLQRIAEVLHIRYNYLVAIEDGRYEDLPGQAYAIGFVRAYADHLGLDGDEIVRRYKEESTGVKARAVFEFPLPTPDSGVPSGALILVAIVFGMMVYGIWYSIAGADRSAVQVIQEVPDRITALLNPGQVTTQPTGAVTPEPAPAAAGEDQTDDTVFDESDALPPADTAEDDGAVIEPAGPAVAAPPQGGAVLPGSAAPAVVPAPVEVVELRAKSDLWVTLRAVEKADRTQFLKKGEAFRVPESGMSLITGTPGDLEILIDGQVMPPLDASVFAKGVALDPQRLKGTAVSP